MKQAQLVLASESPYRRELLDRLRVPYTACRHQCDERAVVVDSLDKHALTLAAAKADSIAAQYPGHYILGSDQLAELDGVVLNKPGSHDAACEQLARLAGRTHRLLTGVVLRSPSGEHQSHLSVHQMQMRPLCTEEIERYVRADCPLDCCGSYKIESLGISLFAEILGADWTAITGLPLIAVSTMLRNVGFATP